MSEDDRAAKAARGKAMLKKRQAQKAAEAGGVSTPRVASPAPRTASPAPRRSTPALSEQAVMSTSPPALASAPSPVVQNSTEKVDGNVADLFSNGPSVNGGDTSWLSGLSRIESAPPVNVVSPAPRYANHPPPQVVTSPPASTKEREDLHALVRDQKQTITRLEGEKASLSASLETLSHSENRIRQAQESLQAELKAERIKETELENNVRRLQSDLDQLSQQARQQEKTVASLEAERNALQGSLSDLNSAVEKAEQALHAEHQNSVKLQEHIQELEQSADDASERIEQQQQTISLLVSEKASLTSAVERLEHTDAALQDTDKRLQAEISRNAKLAARVSQFESESTAAASTIAVLTESEKLLTDKSRDQEREIQLLNGTVHDLRTQSEEYQRRARELEEQIESDDRAERLEETLKHTQDRADELEFQLSKMRQVREDLQAERDALAARLNEKTAVEADWEARHAEVEKQHSATQEQLSSAITERDGLLAERTVLQTDLEGSRNLVSELQQKLATLSSDVASNTRQFKQLQAELKAAHARADEAEKTQKELQAEGIGLMRSLDEMRPKIVELTDEKLSLGEKAENLQKTIQARDAVIAQLESNLEELRDDRVSIERERNTLQAALENERAALQKDSTELQQAYSELQAELTTCQKTVNDLQDERGKLRQVANSNVEEIRRLTDTVQTQSTQLTSLRSELSERTQAQNEAQEFLARAQADMESLQLDLSQKEEELERLRETASAPPSRTSAGDDTSLDEEMLSALRQQHALELSAAHSQVRALQTAVFDAEAQAHALQRQAAALEDELAQLRTLHRPSSRTSSAHHHHHHPHTLKARAAIDHSDDLRRQSFHSNRPAAGGLSPPASMSAFEGLSPEARHKRKVSLSMLKARIDSEVAASSSHTLRPSSRRSLTSPVHQHAGLPAVVEPPSQPATPPPQIIVPKRPVFMDEAHIFWCHSCQGDLVVL